MSDGFYLLSNFFLKFHINSLKWKTSYIVHSHHYYVWVWERTLWERGQEWVENKSRGGKQKLTEKNTLNSTGNI